MKKSRIIIPAAATIMSAMAIIVGVAYFVHLRELNTIQRLPEASAIKQALTAKMEWDRKFKPMREAIENERETEKHQKQRDQATLKLASELGLSVWSVIDYQNYPCCRKTEYYMVGFGNYETNDSDCILIRFVERAKKNNELMHVIRLAKVAGLNIELNNRFGFADPISGVIFINADTNDQVIIEYLTKKAEIK